MARVMSFGVRPAVLQILGNAGERSGDSVALVLKASASSRNRAGRPVLNGFRAYTVAERRAVHFAPGAPPTLPGGVAPGVSVLAGGRSSRRGESVDHAAVEPLDLSVSACLSRKPNG